MALLRRTFPEASVQSGSTRLRDLLRMLNENGRQIATSGLVVLISERQTDLQELRKTLPDLALAGIEVLLTCSLRAGAWTSEPALHDLPFSDVLIGKDAVGTWKDRQTGQVHRVMNETGIVRSLP